MSSNYGGGEGAAARRVLRSSAASYPKRERPSAGLPPGVSSCSSSSRDFAHAMANYFNQTHGRPSWRKSGRHEGFRIVAVKPEHIRRLSRKVGAVRVPKVGWVRFRLSRAFPDGVRSYRVTCDRMGRWHVSLAVVPASISGPGTGKVVGIDRGVAVSAALSTGELSERPGLVRLGGGECGCFSGNFSAVCASHRRARIKVQVARLYAKQSDMRKDWCEKLPRTSPAGSTRSTSKICRSER